MKTAKRLTAYLIAILLIISQLTCLCGVTAFADGLPSALSSGFLRGVNLHHSGKYAYQSIYSAILEAKALGSNIVRINYDPGEIGYNDDDLSYLKSVAEIVDQNDMQLVLVLDGFNQVFRDDDDSYTNAIIAANYSAMATELAGKVAYYQIGNEIDNVYKQYRDYGFSSRAAVAQKAASALNAAKTAIVGADSSAQFILNFTWTHYEFLTAVYNQGYDWDVTGFDWYSNMSVENGNTYYQTVINKVINDYGKQVIVCEAGLYPDDNNGTVTYQLNADWLGSFANYCDNRANVIGFILYELYDEGDPYDEEDTFMRENCFGLFDIEKEEKAITPYIRALFGGSANTRIENPVVPSNSYAVTDVAIDAAGVAGRQGKLFSWLGANITHKGFTAVDISNRRRIEFDLYVEDYDAFMTAYENAGFSSVSGSSSFRLRLLNTADVGSNYAKVDLDIGQITQSGWNHISVDYDKFSKSSFDPSSVTGYDLYMESYGGVANRNYLNAASGMVFAIGNLYATGVDTANQVPAISNADSAFVIREGVCIQGVLGSSAITGQGHLPGYSGGTPAEVIFTNPGLSDYGRFEFDFYIDDITNFNTRAVKLYLNVRTNSQSKGTVEFDDQIIQSGWNHVAVTPALSSDVLNSITKVRFYMDIDAGATGAEDRYKVANICATEDPYSLVPAMPESEDVFAIGSGARIQGVLGSSAITGQGHLPGYSGGTPAEVIFTNPGLAAYDYFEFDCYIDDITNFNTRAVKLYLNVRTNSQSKGTFEFDEQITHSGWNHVKITAALSSDNLNSITKARYYMDIDAGETGATDRYRIANICATKLITPAKNNILGEAVGELNVGNGLITCGWKEGRYNSAGCYQEGLTAVDLSDADYIELDLYVDSRQGILDAIADLDSINGDAGARWRFMLSSTSGDYRGSNYTNVYYLENLENYITKDGWNHIAIPVSAFAHTGSATLESIASWGIDFYVATSATNIAKDQKVAVYNICATKIVTPEKNNANGTTAADLNAGNGLLTSGWKEGRYNSAGCYQEKLTAVDLSGADYIEFDMFVESKQGILDAIADLDSINGDAGARWRFMLSSISGDYRGSNYTNVYYLENLENYITKDGWNHIAIPVSAFAHTGSATLSSIASWGIDFYVATSATNIAKDQKVGVYNICGTKAYTDIAGDVNNDGTTDILDLIRAKKVAAEIKTEYNPNVATFDASGLGEIRSILLGLIS